MQHSLRIRPASSTEGAVRAKISVHQCNLDETPRMTVDVFHKLASRVRDLAHARVRLAVADDHLEQLASFDPWEHLAVEDPPQVRNRYPLNRSPSHV